MTVFISYAKEDEEIATKLYGDLQRLDADPWIDQEDLLPGQDWERAIQKAIKGSSFFLALLSQNSVGKRGYVQKELRTALDYLEQFPPDDIFVIPVRLDESEPQHERLARLHWVDLFPSYNEGLAKICRSMELEPPPAEEMPPQSTAQAPPSDQSMPDDVVNLIRENAKAQHPDDFSTQRYVIQNQTKAWEQLQDFSPEDLPEEITEAILTAARDDHPNDFSTQIYVARKEVDAWRQIRTLTSEEVPANVIHRIKQKAASDHPGDYSTQFYVIIKELAAWKQMNC